MTQVLHLTYALDFGGVEKHLELIAAEPGKAMTHAFAAIHAGGAAADAIARSGAQVHVLGVDPHRRPSAAVRALVRLFRQVRPDVLHCHGAEANLFGLTAGWLAGVSAQIGEEIGMPEHGWKARIAFRAAYGTADRVIAVADAVRDWLIASREVPPGKVIRIYNPVKSSARRAAVRRPGEPLRVAFLGRLHPIKNALALIEAVATLRGRGVAIRLLVIGDGPLRADAESLVGALALDQQVTLAGFQADPGDLLSTCHLLVQPSLSEGLSLALVEAMGMGMPVISTRVGGSPEIVEEGRTGWIVDRTDPVGLADAIARAEALPGDGLAQMGNAARAWVGDRFDPANYLRTLEDLYRRVLASKA